jgi:putative phage-type endonuclease
MFINELEDLEDITDTLVFEDEPSIFTESCAVELVETALHLMDEYMELHPHVISEPNFQEILLEEILDIFYIQMEDHIDDLDIGDDIEDDMNDLLLDAFNIFITIFHPDKSFDCKDKEIEFVELNDKEVNIIENKIQKLREIPQPVQRTPEWYQFRWNLITASNAWKALESQSAINQLIYEKCQPIKTINDNEEIKMVNVNSPMHWGQKYEPLSVMIYEKKYGTKVEDFGCIQHSTYNFLGASPDGIIINKESDRYGRMLEIKNVVSREINGIPKKEYWTQMQLQMEVCDLDECDFLETKFTEYTDYHSYKNDTLEDMFEDPAGVEFQNFGLSTDNKTKGVIIYFNTKEGKPFYIYKPLDIIRTDAIQDWSEDMVDYYTVNPQFNYTFLKFIYWKLEVLSCILVLRKRDWFKNNICLLENVWKTIEKERVTGYEHRAPVKKQKKNEITSFFEKASQGCLLKFNKIIKLDTYNDTDVNNTD